MTISFLRLFLPYCLKREPDGRYAVLNRKYKPAGMATQDHVVYADFPCVVKLQGLTPAKAAKLSCHSKPDLDAVYLYEDGCVPTDSAAHWAAYSARLALLAKLTIPDTQET